MKIEKLNKLMAILFISSIPMMPLYTINVHYGLGFICMFLYMIDVICKKRLTKFACFEFVYLLFIVYATIRIDSRLVAVNETYISYAYYMIKNMIFNFFSIILAIRLLISVTKDMKKTIEIVSNTFVISTVIISVYSIVYEYLIMNDITRLGSKVFEGKYGERMTFTHNIMMSFFFLIYQILNILEKKEKKPIKEVIILGFLLIVAILTGTRKLLLALPLFAIFYLIFGKKLTIKSAFIATIVLIIAVLIGYILVMNVPFLYDLFGSRIDSLILEITEGSGDGSSWERNLMKEKGWDYFLADPIFGIGTDGFRFRFKSQTRIFKYSHNNYIELLADLGIIGFIIYYGWMILNLIFLLKRKSQGDNKNLDLFFIASIFTIAILDYWNVSYYRPQFLLIFALSSFQLLSNPTSITQIAEKERKQNEC